MFVRAVSAFFFVAGTLATFPTHAEGSSAGDGRHRFRLLLDTLAARSVTSPLKCQESTSHEGPKPVQYKLSIEPEPSYVDAYFVRFQAVDGSRQWSTLVAYEGRNGVQLGAITVKTYEGNTLYEHDFNGILTDRLLLKTREGRITELLYRKISTDANRPIFELHCPLRRRFARDQVSTLPMAFRNAAMRSRLVSVSAEKCASTRWPTPEWVFGVGGGSDGAAAFDPPCHCEYCFTTTMGSLIVK